MNTCPLCFSTNHHDVFHFPKSLRSDAYFSETATHKIQCCDCGIVRTKNISQFHEQYYTKDYSLHSESKEQHQKIDTYKAEWVKRFISKDIQSICEIGSWTGGLISQINIPTRFAFEPNTKACMSHHYQNIQIVNAGYSHLSQYQEQFDMIFSFAVIEHVENPNEFLRLQRQAIKKTGKILLICPIQDTFSFDILFHDHIFHFHSSHIISLAKSVGLQMIKQDLLHDRFYYFGAFLFEYCVPDSSIIPFFNTGIHLSKIMMMFDKINDFIKNKKNIIIVGNGETSAVFQRFTELRDKTIAIIDDFTPDVRININIFQFSTIPQQIITEAEGLVLCSNPIHYPILEQKIIDCFGSIQIHKALAPKSR